MNKEILKNLKIAQIQAYRAEFNWELSDVNVDGISIYFINEMILAKLKGSRYIMDFAIEMDYYRGKQEMIVKLISVLKKSIVFIKEDDIERAISCIEEDWIKYAIIGLTISIETIHNPMIVHSEINPYG